MKKTHFEWDEVKDKENQKKHNVSFTLAQHAFLDPHRIIVLDLEHSVGESILLHRTCWRRDHNCSIYVSRKCYPSIWCRILDEREKNL